MKFWLQSSFVDNLDHTYYIGTNVHLGLILRYLLKSWIFFGSSSIINSTTCAFFIFYELKCLLVLSLWDISFQSQKYVLGDNRNLLLYSDLMTARLRWRGLRNCLFVVVLVIGKLFWIPRKKWTFTALLAGFSRK